MLTIFEFAEVITSKRIEALAPSFHMLVFAVRVYSVPVVIKDT